MSKLLMPTDDLPCQTFVELVTEYLEGTLPSEMVVAVEDHLSQCRHCLEYLRQMRRVIALLDQAVEDTVPPAMKDALIARFREYVRLELQPQRS